MPLFIEIHGQFKRGSIVVQAGSDIIKLDSALNEQAIFSTETRIGMKA